MGADWLAGLDEDERAAVRACGLPDWIEPMQATLTHEVFSDARWLFEPKLDGIRCLAYRDGEHAALYTRNRKRRDPHYPEIGQALVAQRCPRFVVDGEVVAFKASVTSFSRLQARAGIDDPAEARASGVPVYFYVFDCPWLAGYDLRGLPLRQRKRLLHRALTFDDPLRFSPHRNTEGEAFFDRARRAGWEGVMAKRADSRYLGRRSRDWRKFRADNQQEFVIGGFTRPQGSRIGFGALLLGYYEDGALRYAGRVGTGFDQRLLRWLGRRLLALERKTSPFDEATGESAARWVTPRLIAETAFTEFTEDGKLRHPRFLGLRHDKPAADVVRERAE